VTKKKLQKIIPHISYLKPIDTLKNILLQKWSALLWMFWNCPNPSESWSNIM